MQPFQTVMPMSKQPAPACMLGHCCACCRQTQWPVLQGCQGCKVVLLTLCPCAFMRLFAASARGRRPAGGKAAATAAFSYVQPTTTTPAATPGRRRSTLCATTASPCHRPLWPSGRPCPPPRQRSRLQGLAAATGETAPQGALLPRAPLFLQSFLESPSSSVGAVASARYEAFFCCRGRPLWEGELGVQLIFWKASQSIRQRLRLSRAPRAEICAWSVQNE